MYTEDVDVDEKRSIKFCRTKSKATDIIKAVLGENDGCTHIEVWQHFRNALVSDETLNSFWADPQFKWGFQLVCYVTDVIVETEHNYDHPSSENDNAERFDWLAGQLVGDCSLGDDQDHQSILKMIEAIGVIGENAEKHGMKDYDISDFKIIFDTISRSQQLVMKAAKEEKALASA